MLSVIWVLLLTRTLTHTHTHMHTLIPTHSFISWHSPFLFNLLHSSSVLQCATFFNLLVTHTTTTRTLTKIHTHMHTQRERGRQCARFDVIYTFFCHIKRRFALHKQPVARQGRRRGGVGVVGFCLGWVTSDIPQSAINMRATVTHTHTYTYTDTYVMAHLNSARQTEEKFGE